MQLRRLLLAPMTAAAVALGIPAIAANNSLTFQGVTFETTALDDDTLRLSILNADTGASGNWTGIDYLWAFEIKNIGNVTSASISPPNLTPADKALSAKGCNGGNSPGMCFEAPAPIALTDNMQWEIDFTGAGLNLLGIDPGTDSLKSDFGIIGPHLKVAFLSDLSQDCTEKKGVVTCNYNKRGDLLSLNLAPVAIRITTPITTPIPEPEIYAMMLAGLGLMGFVARRRKQTATA